MRVLLKLQLDCEAETAWIKLHEPETFAAVFAPLIRVRPLEPGGFPATWERGEYRIQLRLLGVIPMGTQLVKLDFRENTETGINVLRDTGGALGGPLALLRGWDHRMAVSAMKDGRTLYRDQLRASGPFSVLAWPVLWLAWQWRAARLTWLARDW